MFSRKTCDQIHIDIVESQFSCQMENADYIFHCVTSSDHIQCLLLHGLWIDGNSANSMLSDHSQLVLSNAVRSSGFDRIFFQMFKGKMFFQETQNPVHLLCTQGCRCTASHINRIKMLFF